MKIKSPKQIINIIFFTILLDMLGLGILIPVYPMLVASNSSFRIIPATWSIAQGYIMLGWLMAVFFIFQFLFTPVLGQLSDKFGRKKVLIYSILGTAVSYILFAYGLYTKNLPLLFISRTIDGISGGNISTANAVIGDVSLPEHRARNFGLVGIALGLGFILGPFFGGKLSDPNILSWFNPTTPFYFAAILSTINLLFVIIKMPETLTTRTTKRLNITKPFSNIKRAFLIPGMATVIVPIFLFNCGFALFTTFFGVVLAEKYIFTSSQIGDYFAYTGIMMVFAQGLLVRRLSGRVQNHQVLKVSLILTGISLVVYYFVPSTHAHLLYFIPPFIACGTSLTRSFSQALLTDIAPATIRGEIMGINSSSFALSQIIPSILVGYIASTSVSLPTLLGGILAILGGIYFIKIFKSN